MLISVLSAVYNEEDHIEQMIQSLFDQSHAEWELVFVSDGSTDRTDALLYSAASKDSRVKVVHTGSKLGKAEAFNSAFAACSGSIIVLLGGDDTMPPRGLSVRADSLRDITPEVDDVVAFFKIRTMSSQPRFDGLVLPRGGGASHSGGTITLTRSLANKVFPIDGALVSEDLWLSRAAEGIASEVRESREVVLHYRIHGGNSNPRQADFHTMSRSIGLRHAAYSALLNSDRLALSLKSRTQLSQLARAEQLRSDGKPIKLMLYRGLPFSDRAAYAAMASPLLFWFRKRLFRLLSGRRSR